MMANLFAPLLARALDGDISWYENGEDRSSFVNYIAVQHMRTRRVKERTSGRLKDRMGLDSG